MYCPSCGSELTAVKLLQPLRRQSEAALKSVLARRPPNWWARPGQSHWLLCWSRGGFGMMFALVMTLISTGVNLSGGGMALIVFCLLIILAVVSLLVRQLSRVIDFAQLSTGATQSKQPHQPMLSEKPAPQIGASREPVASVTEHTTRMFEPILKSDTQR